MKKTIFLISIVVFLVIVIIIMGISFYSVYTRNNQEVKPSVDNETINQEGLKKVIATPEEVNYYKTVTLPYYEEIIAELDWVWQLYWQDSATQFASGGSFSDYVKSLRELTNSYKALQSKLHEVPIEHLTPTNAAIVQQAVKDLNTWIETRLEAIDTLRMSVITGNINKSAELEIKGIIAEGDKMLVLSNAKIYGLDYDLSNIDDEYIEIPNKEEVVNEELYNYVYHFLTEVVDKKFSVHVRKSMKARSDYEEGKIDLTEAVMVQDMAIYEVSEAIQNFELPNFGDLSAFEIESLQVINKEVKNIGDAYERQILGQKGFTFVTAEGRGDGLIGVSGESLPEQRKSSQKLVDESADEILAFEKTVIDLCNEILYKMESK